MSAGGGGGGPCGGWGTSLPPFSTPRLLVLIGPEGDFAPEEIAAAQQAGAYPISLGSLILRCETAAISALTLVLYALRLTPQGVLWHSCNGKQVKAPTERANPSKGGDAKPQILQG